MLRNAQFPKIYDALLKPNLKTSLKQFFKGVVHEQPWYIIVWFVWRVHYCVQLLSWGHDFLIFSIISFTFSFAIFSFNYLVTFLVSFIWNSQKFPISQNIWCLIKTKLKIITQTIFQGGSPWATLIHNSVVCLEGTLLCPAASWGDLFFLQSFPLPFPLLFFFLLIN